MPRIHRIAFLLAVTFFCLGTIVSSANVGEDITQLRSRYGSAQMVGGQALFQHDGYSICVYFDGSHSAMEVFVRDGSKPDKKEITPSDVDQILDSQGAGQTWITTQGKTGKSAWVRSDGKLVAKLTEGDVAGDRYLTVMVNAK